MVICDICFKLYSSIYISSANVRGLDLCEFHNKQLDESMLLLHNLFKSTEDRNDQEWLSFRERLLPTENPDAKVIHERIGNSYKPYEA